MGKNKNDKNEIEGMKIKKENIAEKEKSITKKDKIKEKNDTKKRNWNDYLELEKIKDTDINIKMNKISKENNREYILNLLGLEIPKEDSPLDKNSEANKGEDKKHIINPDLSQQVKIHNKDDLNLYNDLNKENDIVESNESEESSS